MRSRFEDALSLWDGQGYDKEGVRSVFVDHVGPEMVDEFESLRTYIALMAKLGILRDHAERIEREVINVRQRAVIPIPDTAELSGALEMLGDALRDVIDCDEVFLLTQFTRITGIEINAECEAEQALVALVYEVV